MTAEAFAEYGQIIAPLRTGGQGAETGYDPETSLSEAKLVLDNGEPRLWIMHLPHVGLGFTRIARHRRITQCLGSLLPRGVERAASRNSRAKLAGDCASSRCPVRSKTDIMSQLRCRPD